MTTETNAERIERIKGIEGCLVDGQVVLSESDCKWLIQQAERAQRLDKEKSISIEQVRVRDKIIKGYEGSEEENARFRETLESIGGIHLLDPKIRNDYREALIIAVLKARQSLKGEEK